MTTRIHGIKLSTKEQELLDDSYNDTMRIRRMVFVWVDAVLAILVILALLIWDISPRMMALVSIAYLLVSVVEKRSYAQVIYKYKALVRRLVARSEDLVNHPERIAEEHIPESNNRPTRVLGSTA